MFGDIYRGKQLSATWLGRAAVQTLTSGGSDVAIEEFCQRKTGIFLTHRVIALAISTGTWVGRL